ncbi:helix-turn-helix transcriptional regulator [Bacteriovorax sp. PP10]|uniref:Helix-turn-helix transcriptional regulator n=1 Tax=Bacteriovorax antarcticus TaxID=3088717 RepID=A0ABU5VW10_9BACT|nr:helix-turn-helix transcriptional regulator [Bacteriovorax sp. PP10]MEA9357253.1 helix-turn-helix transcriptional regulator [Bacteriovorax sp. PP10]
MTINSNETIAFFESLLGGPLTFGQMIHSLRTTDEISQTDLAKRAKVSKGLICDIEKGRRDASIELAVKLAKIMGYLPESFVSILLEEQIRRAKLNFKVILEKAA